ncbi:MAG: hypothetical protein ACJ798_12500 [Phenylobacterium sp.]
MRTPSELRDGAADAERLARRAASHADRAQLLEIARAWQSLAESAERAAAHAEPAAPPDQL